MKTINLRELYPDAYMSDYFVQVPDEIAEVFITFERMENAYKQRTYYHRAYFTLDCSDGIEQSVVFRSLTPEEIYERKLTREQLHAAISSLPDKQAKRIYAHYILGISRAEIAKAEGVGKSTVTLSIQRGMRELARRIKKF